MAFMYGILENQIRREKTQIPSADIRADFRHPVVAVMPSKVKIATVPTEVSSAEEGEGF